jgi:manganese/zinc/iron transport system ATP- binding protein
MTLDLVTNSAFKADETARADSPLAIRGLTVSYGQKPAVFSVDMTVEPGKMTAIIGPNGAGKSTMLAPPPFLANPSRFSAIVLPMCRNAPLWIGISRHG